VNILSAIGRLLSVLAIVGLAVAPLARPVLAMTAVAQSAIASDHAAADGAPMMDDMPCCPKKAPVPDCNKDCLAICSMQLLSNAVHGAGLLIPLGLADILVPANDVDVAGLRQPPPPRPPKI
jgi:hypothetical protein